MVEQLQTGQLPAYRAFSGFPRRGLAIHLSRTPARIIGGIVFAIAVPILISFDSPAAWLRDQGQFNAACGSLVALLVATYMLKQISAFPGIREGIYIVPALSAGFALVLAALVFGRIDYSRTQLIEAYLFSICWFFALSVATERTKRRRLAVVPGGDCSGLAALPGAQWLFLQHPKLRPGECDAVVADLRADLAPAWQRFVADCAVAGIPVYHFKQVKESLTGRVEIEHLSENNLGSLVPNFAYSRFKWAIDWLLAALALALLWPVLIVIAVAIKRDSPGPALFLQERMGFRGQPITVFKFRTMRHVEGEEQTRLAAVTEDGDGRITKLGGFLRRSRLDELPQIFNILLGQMSWIGPRPEAMELSRWYEGEIPFYRYRHIVKPGISGWAQINQGHVADVEAVTAKLHYDFFYIRNFSPWLDLLILMRTFATVLTGFGAK